MGDPPPYKLWQKSQEITSRKMKNISDRFRRASSLAGKAEAWWNKESGTGYSLQKGKSAS